MTLFLIYFAVLIAGILIGICAAIAYLATDTFDIEMDVLLDQVGERDSSELLNYLEKSECNLFYNSTINAWALLDSKDKIVAAGHSVRTALRRAQSGDIAQRLADDFTNAELAQVKRSQATINYVAKV